MLLRPSGRSTDLSKSNSASAWITTDWRTEAGAGLAAGAGAAGAAGGAGDGRAAGGGGGGVRGAAGAGGADGAAGAGAGAGAALVPAHSGRTWPDVTTQAPEPSLTALPEPSCRLGVTLAKAEPATSAIAQPSVSEEIFIF